MRKIVAVLVMMMVVVGLVSAMPLPKKVNSEIKAMSKQLFGKEIVPTYDCCINGRLLPYFVGTEDVTCVFKKFIDVADKQAGSKFRMHTSITNNNTNLNEDVELLTRTYGASCTIYYNYLGKYVIVTNYLNYSDNTISTVVREWY
jgi:hypothetical protein